MRRCLITLLVFIVFAVGMWGVPVAPVSARQSTVAPQDVIAALNAWRLEKGLWPLKPNTTLDTLALGQAQYLISLPELPDDMHAGRRGEDPKARAQQAGWPSYNRSEQIAIGEIAYVGKDVTSAINWWQRSPIHQRTVENPAYREIGVGVLPHRFGSLIIVVLGGRPNVLPALTDPQAGRLYLSNEQYQWAASGDGWVYNASRVRLFDSEGRPLSITWQDWTPFVPLPSVSGDRLFVAYTNGNQQAISEVRLNTDRVLLPGQSAPPVVNVVPTALPALTATPPPTTSVGAALPATAPPTLVPPTALPGPTSTSLAHEDVRIVYDNRSLALVNVSDRPLDLTGLVLVQGSSRLPASNWQTQWMTVSMSAFPARDCVQVWSWSEPAALNPPSICRIQRSVINLAADRLFWTKGPFDVYQGAMLITTCPAGGGTCAVGLP
jgi:uncharacterized protein YkwD